MRTIAFPSGYLTKENFPNLRVIKVCEGGSISAAEKDGKFYLYTNEGGLSDFLIPGEDDDLQGLLRSVYEFDSSEERERYMHERGWDKLMDRPTDWPEEF